MRSGQFNILSGYRISSMLLAEGTFPVRSKSGVADCFCRVTFDLNRKHPIQIACLRPLPAQKRTPLLIPDGPYFVETSLGSEPIECLVLEMDQRDDGILVSLLPVSSAIFENGLPLVRINAGIINFNQYWFD